MKNVLIHVIAQKMLIVHLGTTEEYVLVSLVILVIHMVSDVLLYLPMTDVRKTRIAQVRKHVLIENVLIHVTQSDHALQMLSVRFIALYLLEQ